MSGIQDEKLKALNSALSQIEKDFGKGSVMKLGEAGSMAIDVIPTGSIGLDIAVGIGGLPKGRIVEIYGPESSGKTTVTLHAIAEAQKQGGIAAFIDAEHALDPVYAKALGVDVDNLIVSQPDTGEQALEITEALIRSGAIDIIVVDSVAVFINQLREKVGIMFGNPETTTGGRALKFYSSVRLDVRKIDTIKQGDKVMGSRTRVKVVKNKVAPPFKQCEFDIMYGEGISKVGDLLDIAADVDIIKKSGAWYSYNDMKLGQGRENVKKFLMDNPDLAEEVEDLVRKHYKLDQNRENAQENEDSLENIGE